MVELHQGGSVTNGDTPSSGHTYVISEEIKNCLYDPGIFDVASL